MKKSKAGIIVLVLLALAAAASAQISIPWSRYTPPKIDLTGQGARALGMGGAFIGLADDATAISWNPAGLAQLDRPEISFVGRFDRASSGFEEKSTSIGTLDPDKSRTHFAFNFASVVFPLKVKERNLAIALAAKQELDMFRVNEVHEPDYYDYTESWSGDVYTASLGLAYQVTPQMALGGAFHYWTGSPGGSGQFVRLQHPDHRGRCHLGALFRLQRLPRGLGPVQAVQIRGRPSHSARPEVP